MKRFLTYPVLLIHLFSTPAFADFSKADEAYYNEDRVAGTRELTKLAENGDVEAQYYLGFVYYDVDEKTAFKWLLRAAEQGHASAQYLVAVRYRDGTGVVQNYMAAIKWYTLAAEQGDKSAQFSLARMYLETKGVKDTIRAHMWFNIAASQGSEAGGWNRDMLAEEMTPAEINKAQAMARECVDNNYKGC